MLTRADHFGYNSIRLSHETAFCRKYLNNKLGHCLTNVHVTRYPSQFNISNRQKTHIDNNNFEDL